MIKHLKLLKIKFELSKKMLTLKTKSDFGEIDY